MKRVFIFTIIMALSITMLVGCNSKNGDKRESEDLKETTAEKANTGTTTNELKDEKYPQISKLVNKYLDAYLIKDAEKRNKEIAKYVDNVEAIDEDEIQYKDYIASYSDIECYTKKGLKRGEFVVYAYHQIKFKNIATSAPGITVLYVIRDDKSKKYRIHNGIKSNSDIGKYIEKVSKDKDVQELYKSVEDEFYDACKSDKYLKDFIAKIKSNKEAK